MNVMISNLFFSFVVGPAISIEKCAFAFLPCFLFGQGKQLSLPPLVSLYPKLTRLPKSITLPFIPLYSKLSMSLSSICSFSISKLRQLQSTPQLDFLNGIKIFRYQSCKICISTSLPGLLLKLSEKGPPITCSHSSRTDTVGGIPHARVHFAVW